MSHKQTKRHGRLYIRILENSNIPDGKTQPSVHGHSLTGSLLNSASPEIGITRGRRPGSTASGTSGCMAFASPLTPRSSRLPLNTSRFSTTKTAAFVTRLQVACSVPGELDQPAESGKIGSMKSNHWQTKNRENPGSALLPRQPIKTPAIVRRALMVVVKLAFESVQHVVNVGEAVLFQVLPGFFRSVAGTADQDHRPVM
jgi:hypothetical protein